MLTLFCHHKKVEQQVAPTYMQNTILGSVLTWFFSFDYCTFWTAQFFAPLSTVAHKNLIEPNNIRGDEHMTGTDTLTACLGSVAPCGGAPGGPRPLTFYYPANEPPGPSLGLALASVRSRHGEGVCRSELSSVSGPRWTDTAAPSVIGLLFGSLRSRACAHGRLLFLNTMPTWSKV